MARDIGALFSAGLHRTARRGKLAAQFLQGFLLVRVGLLALMAIADFGGLRTSESPRRMRRRT